MLLLESFVLLRLSLFIGRIFRSDATETRSILGKNVLFLRLLIYIQTCMNVWSCFVPSSFKSYVKQQTIAHKAIRWILLLLDLDKCTNCKVHCVNDVHHRLRRADIIIP